MKTVNMLNLHVHNRKPITCVLNSSVSSKINLKKNKEVNATQLQVLT